MKEIHDVVDGETCAVVGTVMAISKRPKFVSLTVRDKSGTAQVYLFGRKYLPVHEGEKVIVCGQAKRNEQYHSVNIYPMAVSTDIAAYRRIVPVYKKIRACLKNF